MWEVSAIPADSFWKAVIYFMVIHTFFSKQNLHKFQLKLKHIRTNSTAVKKGDQILDQILRGY